MRSPVAIAVPSSVRTKRKPWSVPSLWRTATGSADTTRQVSRRTSSHVQLSREGRQSAEFRKESCVGTREKEDRPFSRRVRTGIALFERPRPHSATQWRTGTRRQPAMQTRNTIFTMTMPFVIIPSKASESSGETICRPCEVIIPASRQALPPALVCRKRPLGTGFPADTHPKPSH
jgi:hypothetical protein